MTAPSRMAATATAAALFFLCFLFYEFCRYGPAIMSFAIIDRVKGRGAEAEAVAVAVAVSAAAIAEAEMRITFIHQI